MPTISETVEISVVEGGEDKTRLETRSDQIALIGDSTLISLDDESTVPLVTIPTVEVLVITEEITPLVQTVERQLLITDTIPGAVGPRGEQGEQGIQGIPGPVGPAGIEWRGEWLSDRAYQTRDAVSFNSSSYLCVLNNTGAAPNVNPEYWELLAAGSTSLTYTHNQIASTTEWVIVHGLNKFPSVTLVDSGKNIIYGDVHYDSPNQIRITLNAATSGQAFLN
jgi:hypothetical protein